MPPYFPELKVIAWHARTAALHQPVLPVSLPGLQDQQQNNQSYQLGERALHLQTEMRIHSVLEIIFSCSALIQVVRAVDPTNFWQEEGFELSDVPWVTVTNRWVGSFGQLDAVTSLGCCTKGYGLLLCHLVLWLHKLHVVMSQNGLSLAGIGLNHLVVGCGQFGQR